MVFFPFFLFGSGFMWSFFPFFCSVLDSCGLFFPFFLFGSGFMWSFPPSFPGGSVVTHWVAEGLIPNLVHR